MPSPPLSLPVTFWSREFLAGGFKQVFFPAILGDGWLINLYFQEGLKPPTRLRCRALWIQVKSMPAWSNWMSMVLVSFNFFGVFWFWHFNTLVWHVIPLTNMCIYMVSTHTHAHICPCLACSPFWYMGLFFLQFNAPLTLFEWPMSNPWNMSMQVCLSRYLSWSGFPQTWNILRFLPLMSVGCYLWP